MCIQAWRRRWWCWHFVATLCSPLYSLVFHQLILILSLVSLFNCCCCCVFVLLLYFLHLSAVRITSLHFSIHWPSTDSLTDYRSSLPVIDAHTLPITYLLLLLSSILHSVIRDACCSTVFSPSLQLVLPDVLHLEKK